MRIAVMGAGGVGGYYGGLLARAGHDVTFIARGPHLEALRRKGLQVYSVHGDFTVAPAQATDTPAEVGPVDLLLVCVKTPDTEHAASRCRSLVATHTSVVSLQNGIDAAERLGSVLGAEHIVGGVTWISSVIESPGVIRQLSQFRRVVVGELDGRITARVQAIAEALGGAGATAEVTDDVLKVLWTKFVFIASISGLGCLTRLETGAYRDVPETRALLVGLAGEVEAVARASGVPLEPDVVQQTIAMVDGMAPHIKPSIQRDVEAGRRSELESMIGVIGRRGRTLGVATPISDMVYAVVLPVELAARKKLDEP
jgi:2-dehydropantoate 2-reductase